MRAPLSAAALATLLACKATGPGEPIGASAGARGDRTAAQTSGGAGSGSAPDSDGQRLLPQGYASSYRKLLPEPVVSEGHGVGRFVVTVYANDIAAAAYDAGRAPYPVGALFVAEHAERTAAATRGPTFVMEKRAGGEGGGDAGAGAGAWRFVAVDGQGHVAPAETASMCTACHLDAPRDGVFPLLVAPAATTAPATPARRPTK